MEYRCGLVAALPGIEPGKTFRAVCSTRIALGPLWQRSRFYEPRLIYAHVSQRGEADLNSLQWERIKPTRFLPPGIPGTRPGGIPYFFSLDFRMIALLAMKHAFVGLPLLGFTTFPK